MILGDSLQVMASLAERERLAGKVQCIYFDPALRHQVQLELARLRPAKKIPFETGEQTDISREPEQVKAFRDT